LKHSITDLIKFLADLSGADDINANSDIFSDVGMAGDDFHEMIEKYAKRFSVNMDDYLWYFHCDEEGQSIGANFFKPPYARVNRIAVTPAMLAEFANTGKWSIDYPEHHVPKKRYDLLINSIVVGSLVAAAIIWHFVN
jgi:hypothetical protein